MQISDTHFGTERADVAEALGATAHHLSPDVVVLCGDITQRARRREFAAARRFMQTMPARAAQLAIPGNHDLPLFNLWARTFAPYAGYERIFGSREQLWTAGDLCVLALDATHPRRHKHGALPAPHLRQRLAAAREPCPRDGCLIVAAHQPLWTAWGLDRRQTLIDRHEAARELAAARVDIVLSGHVHVPLIETTAISDPQLAWRFVLSGAGTAVSTRTRVGVPNSFNLLEFERGRLTVTRLDFAEGGFAPAFARTFARGSGGWA